MPKFKIRVTERSEEWSKENAPLQCTPGAPTQCTAVTQSEGPDTPGYSATQCAGDTPGYEPTQSTIDTSGYATAAELAPLQD